MTHSSHRFTMLSADDVALCRAHSDATARDANFRDLKRWADRPGAMDGVYLAACRDFERVTLNQSQSDAYWQWQREVHSRIHIGVDLAQPGGDTTAITLAPAKPAAKHPTSASSFAPGDRIVITSTHAIDLPYFGTGDTGTVVAIDTDRDLEVKFDEDSSAKRGCNWFVSPSQAARIACTSSAANGADLIGANPAVPAQQPAQKASTHSVCIKAHSGVCDFKWRVGDIATFQPQYAAVPECWRASDACGWIPHTPTADSTCQVPDGLAFDYKLRGGASKLYDDPRDEIYWRLLGSGGTHHQDIIAWRPIADGSK